MSILGHIILKLSEYAIIPPQPSSLELSKNLSSIKESEHKYSRSVCSYMNSEYWRSSEGRAYFNSL